MKMFLNSAVNGPHQDWSNSRSSQSIQGQGQMISKCSVLFLLPTEPLKDIFAVLTGKTRTKRTHNFNVSTCTKSSVQRHFSSIKKLIFIPSTSGDLKVENAQKLPGAFEGENYCTNGH